MSARGTQHGTRSPTVFWTHAGPRAKVRDQVSFARAHATFHVNGTHAHAVLDIATTLSRAATTTKFLSSKFFVLILKTSLPYFPERFELNDDFHL